MNKELFKEVIEWQEETFGEATALSKVMHLKEEVEELAVDVVSKGPFRRLEFADCFMLLFGAAAADGMSYEDICEAVKEKMEINRKRTWGKPDENGVVNHIKDSSNGEEME